MLNINCLALIRLVRLCLSFTILSYPLQAIASIEVSGGSSRIEIVGSGAHYALLSTKLKAEKVLSGSFDDQMLPLERNSYGFSDDVLWMTFDLENTEDRTLNLTLSFAYPLLDSIRIFHRSGSADWVKVKIGDRMLAKRGSPGASGAYDFEIQANEKLKFYVGISSGSSLQVNADISERNAFHFANAINLTIYSIFIGAFLALGLYNFFLFTVTGFFHYFTYSMLALTSLLREAYLSGIQYQLFLHSYPVASEALGLINLAFNVACVNIFVMSFLKVKESSKKSYYFLFAMTLISMSYIPLYFKFGYGTVLKPFTIQVMITSISCMIVSFIRYRQGFFVAKHFMAAFWFALVGYFITAMGVTGVIDASLASRIASGAGQFIEMVLLSFALSAYINQIKKEKNAAVLELNQVLQAAVKEKTEDIRTIMNHIPEGICLIRGEEIQISGDYSKYLETIVLRSDLDGQKFLDLVFRGSSLDANTIDQVENTLRSSLGEDPLAFEVNSHLLIKEFEKKNSQHQSEIFAVAWHPVVGDDGLVDEILVVLKNETGFRAIQEEARQKNQQLKLLDELLQVHDERFESFTQTCQQLLIELREFVVSESLDYEKRQHIMRSLHTFKGIARSLNLSELANAIHEAEDILVHAGDNLREALRRKSEGIRTVLERYVEFAHKKLGRNQKPIQAQDERIKLIDSCLLQLAEIQDSMEPKPLKSKIEWVEQQLLDVVGMRLELVLDPLLDGLDSLAQELGKQTPAFQVNTIYPVVFLPYCHHTLIAVFTHLLRNSLDHGIERADVRARKGKLVQGQMTVEVHADANWIRIRFADDGQGLNLKGIYERGIKAGLLEIDTPVSRHDIAELIFRSGFSTAEIVSKISGRGIGLDAVRSELEAAGGSISINLYSDSDEATIANRDFTPFAFEIIVPAEFARTLAPMLAS